MSGLKGSHSLTMSSLLLLLFVCLTTVSFSDADHSDVVIARLLEVQESSSEEGVFFRHSAILCIDMKTISSFLFFKKVQGRQRKKKQRLQPAL